MTLTAHRFQYREHLGYVALHICIQQLQIVSVAAIAFPISIPGLPTQPDECLPRGCFSTHTQKPRTTTQKTFIWKKPQKICSKRIWWTRRKHRPTSPCGGNYHYHALIQQCSLLLRDLGNTHYRMLNNYSWL